MSIKGGPISGTVSLSEAASSCEYAGERTLPFLSGRKPMKAGTDRQVSISTEPETIYTSAYGGNDVRTQHGKLLGLFESVRRIFEGDEQVFKLACAQVFHKHTYNIYVSYLEHLCADLFEAHVIFNESSMAAVKMPATISYGDIMSISFEPHSGCLLGVVSEETSMASFCNAMSFNYHPFDSKAVSFHHYAGKWNIPHRTKFYLFGVAGKSCRLTIRVRRTFSNSVEDPVIGRHRNLPVLLRANDEVSIRRYFPHSTATQRYVVRSGADALGRCYTFPELVLERYARAAFEASVFLNRQYSGIEVRVDRTGGDCFAKYDIEYDDYREMSNGLFSIVRGVSDYLLRRYQEDQSFLYCLRHPSVSCIEKACDLLKKNFSAVVAARATQVDGGCASDDELAVITMLYNGVEWSDV